MDKKYTLRSLAGAFTLSKQTKNSVPSKTREPQSTSSSTLRESIAEEVVLDPEVSVSVQPPAPANLPPQGESIESEE